jgi:hypothetical protein
MRPEITEPPRATAGYTDAVTHIFDLCHVEQIPRAQRTRMLRHYFTTVRHAWIRRVMDRIPGTVMPSSTPVAVALYGR